MGSLKEKRPDCDGASAMLRAGDIQEELFVLKSRTKIHSQLVKAFKVFIVDVAARHVIYLI